MSSGANSDLDNRRKQLRFRSWHRGTQEADLIIGSFADQNVGQMNMEELNLFERVLEIPDPVLYDWIIGNSAPTENMHNKVLDDLLSFKYTPKKR
ncbi:succinate dehydrogenase assembly factor 2 [Kiloniella antarctica]|uniref:FAD assembly factor SdhE n=1 Tax=Kiloniella antarctica TaxID=1550907 RepID=A0ABW5BRF1_9PROT